MGTAGLGLKRKAEHQQQQQQEKNKNELGISVSGKMMKAKTLSEKRHNLQAEILRYGVAAVEKMYPRQSAKKFSPIKPIAGNVVRNSPIRMKPKPIGFEFDEIEARQILRPFSHDKYIHEPDYDSVVYINRRKGLVPLSTLCKDSTTVLPTSVRFLSGRNVRLGKPELYVQHSGRVLAIGGSRRPSLPPIFPQITPVHSFKIVKVPELVKKPFDKCKPFEMDNEFANFAAAAVTIPPKRSSKVDIRTLKKQQKLQDLDSTPKDEPAKAQKESPKDLKSSLAAKKKSISHHLLEKFEKVVSASDEEETEEAEQPLSVESSKLEIKDDPDEEMEVARDASGNENVEDDDDEGSDEEESEDEGEVEDVVRGFKDEIVHNSWAKKIKINHDFNEDKPVIADDFKAAFDERKSKQKDGGFLNGWEDCDLPDCFCKEEPHGQGTATGQATECQTPTADISGTQTPVTTSESAAREKKKVAKNLTKVRRALKVLGVNFYEFDDENGEGKIDQSCDKEFCRLGCVCDTLTRKPLAPAHCGKHECMFSCSCSEDALKIATSPTSANDGCKIGLTDQGSMVQLRSSSLRGMALEERKFVNTVVSTGGGGDLLMLGTSAGRQKRERKMPSRYQDTDAFDAPGGISGGKVDDELDQIEGAHIAVVPIAEEHQAKRLKVEHLKDETIKKCTVLVPRVELPATVKPWCMYHCVHSCPCNKFKNPLDHGPDLTASRNVAKRSIGGQFKTSKQPTPNIRNGRPQTAKRTGGKPLPSTFARTICIGGSEGSSSVNIANVVKPSHPTKNYKFATENHCARTSGLIFRSQNQMQMPHKLVVVNKNDRKAESLSQFSIPGIKSLPKPVIDPKKQRQIQKVIRSKTDLLDLSLKPKGEVQYIRWDVFRHFFENKFVKIWCLFRCGRNVFIVTKSGDLAYAKNAFDIRKYRTVNLEVPFPQMLETLIKEEGQREDTDDDMNKYAILISSGFSWEMNGCLQKKNQQQPEQQPVQTPLVKPAEAPSSTPLSPKGVAAPTLPPANPKLAPAPPKPPLTQQQPMTSAREVDSELTHTCIVSLESSVTKLPSGKNMVTMTKNGEATMQIKLPVTLPNQYWSTIKVDGREGSVQCPDSTLALKVAVLKQAAGLAMKEQTTVRIPIPVAGESESFGVYAVPGLETHVFVGPFKEKTKAEKAPSEPAELICLDDDDVTENKEVGASSQQVSPEDNDDDEIQEIEPDQSPVKSNNDDFVMKYGDPPSEEKPAKLDRKKLIAGQVPQVVSKNDSNDKEVEIVDLDAEEEEVENSEDAENKKDVVYSARKRQYINIKPSNFGRTIFRNERNPIFDDESRALTVVIPNFGNLLVHILNNKVMFPHPTFFRHEVVCSNLDFARQWMLEFIESGKKKRVSKVEDEAKSSKPEPATTKPNSEASTPTEVSSRPKPITTVFQNGDRKSVAILIDRRKMREKLNFFSTLTELIGANNHQRKLSSAEILVASIDLIHSMTVHQTKLEQEKKELMIRRTKLFETFTKKLDGLPVAVKKKAILDLKEALKKGKDASARTSESHSETDKPVEPVPEAVKPVELQPDAQTAGELHIEIQSSESQNCGLNVSGGGGTPYSDLTGLQTIKKDGKVMRPMNAFMLWAKGYRRELIAKGFDGATVSKMLADKWKTLNQEQKQIYYTEADHLKNLHQLQHPDYKYSPKARRQGLPKKGSPTKTPEKSPQHSQQYFSTQQDVIHHTSQPLIPGLIRLVPQDQLHQANGQQHQQPVSRSQIPGLIQIPSQDNHEEKKKQIIEISLD